MTTVLVTGGMGFIGTAVVSRLAVRGPVTVADRLDFGLPDALSPLTRDGRIDVVQTELSVPGDLHGRIARGEFQTIVHLAALHFIPACEARPVDAYRDNVLSTVALMSHAPASTRFVNFSSAAVYRPDETPHTEDATLGPTDVYGWTKKQGEEVASYFARARQLSVFNIRLFNAVGPGETNPHVLPNLLSQVRRGHSRLQLGNLYPLRDFIYIHDIAWVIGELIAGWPLADGDVETLNVGTGCAVSIEELMQRVAQEVGRPLTVAEGTRWRRDVERPYLAADLKKLRHLLSEFRPTPMDEWLPPLVRDPALRVAVD